VNRAPIIGVILLASSYGTLLAEEKPEVRTVAKLSFDEPVRAGLPVWVHITLPQTREYYASRMNIRYPFSGNPLNFGWWGAIKLEVRSGGKSLEPLRWPMRPFAGVGMHSGPPNGSAAPQGSPKQRLPLHLRYDFSKPGTYEVRLTLHDKWSYQEELIMRSEWTKLVVHPTTPEERRVRLAKMLQQDRPKGRGIVVGDLLPSLLAQPNADVLEVVKGFVHHQDGLVQRFALNCICRWGKDVFHREVKSLVKAEGPTVELAYALSHKRDIFNPDEDAELVDSILPWLRSDSVTAAAGATQAVYFMRSIQEWTEGSRVPERLDKAIAEAAEHLIGLNDGQVLRSLACYLGGSKQAGSRKLLWRLAQDPKCRGQALICIGWLNDKRDLERLGKLLVPGDPETDSLPYQLRRAHGEEALPWLVAGLKKSEIRSVRVQCAKELALAGHREGFLFFKAALGDRTSEHSIARGFVHDLMRDGTNAQRSDEELIRFLDKKLKEAGK